MRTEGEPQSFPPGFLVLQTGKPRLIQRTRPLKEPDFPQQNMQRKSSKPLTKELLKNERHQPFALLKHNAGSGRLSR